MLNSICSHLSVKTKIITNWEKICTVQKLGFRLNRNDSNTSMWNAMVDSYIRCIITGLFVSRIVLLSLVRSTSCQRVWLAWHADWRHPATLSAENGVSVTPCEKNAHSEFTRTIVTLRSTCTACIDTHRAAQFGFPCVRTVHERDQLTDW